MKSPLAAFGAVRYSVDALSRECEWELWCGIWRAWWSWSEAQRRRVRSLLGDNGPYVAPLGPDDTVGALVLVMGLLGVLSADEATFLAELWRSDELWRGRRRAARRALALGWGTADEPGKWLRDEYGRVIMLHPQGLRRMVY